MSLSPFKRNARKLSQPTASAPLTLSQALTITAGMAGLIGLFAGGLLRFSLANSPDSRFLSPLQTFPALSDWTPELPQETADSHYLPGGNSEYEQGRSRSTPNAVQTESSILTFEPAEPVDDSDSIPISESLDTEIEETSEPLNTATFDTFAARGNGRQRTAAPLDLLREGPDLRGTRRSLPNLPDSSVERRDERSYDEPYTDEYDERASDGYRNVPYGSGESR